LFKLASWQTRILKSSVLFMMLLLGACGYHLRGSINLPEALKKVYFSSASRELNTAAIKVYKGASGTLVKSASVATVVIRIIDEKYQRRSISTGNAGYSNEYELHYRLQFVVLDTHGLQLAEAETIEQSKTYFNDQSGTTLISKINEESLLREELYIEAVRRILARARALLIQ